MGLSEVIESGEPDAAGEPGARVGHYWLKRLLGRGGMGEVFLAWDERLDRHVAIKRIRGDRVGDARRRARFRREARAIARLSHPGIVQIFDLVETERGEHIVMEYVEGVALARLLSGAGLGLSFAVAIAAELADGLAQAHGKGILHRDLKTENVIITPTGHAKILDFGLAYRLEGEEPGGALTESGMLVGTAHAMSPEQARGGELDGRSDLFALGGVLYAMLTGRAPFGGADLSATLRQVVNEAPAPVRAGRPDVPEELGELIARLLAKDPAERPPHAHEVARQLERMARRMSAAAELGAAAPGAHGVAGAQALAAMSTGAVFPPSPPSPEASAPSAALAFASTATAASLLAVEPALAVPRVVVVIETSVRALRAGRGLSAPLRPARAARGLLSRCHGRELEDARTRYAAQFERAADAVTFALAFHRALKETTSAGEPLHDSDEERLGQVPLKLDLRDIELGAACQARVAIGMGAVGGGVTRATIDASARVLAMARPDQTLLTREVFDQARHAAPELWPAEPGADGAEGADGADGGLSSSLRWLAHGAYALRELVSPIELFEVGVEGASPLLAPLDGESGRKVAAPGDELILGWRPAAGQSIPRRPNWRLRERLGQGGGGEVWLATHPSGERRVFKFCFEATRLRALKREITLFRLLAETLGHRPDIARLLDWSFTEPPAFIESEYSDAGDLVDWSDALGGLAEVPMAQRLELAAEVADALAAAHSVGVLHKDIKPQNVLVTRGHDGAPHAQLADFGIGVLLDREALAGRKVTALGFTEALPVDEPAAGTQRYLAPELLDGKPATVQADLYALGVMIYQLAAGDLWRPLAPGWERDIDDVVLVEDLVELVDRAPERRPASAAEVAKRLRSLEARRRARIEAALEWQRSAEIGFALERSQRRRRITAILAGSLAVVLGVVSELAYRASSAREREQAARLEVDQRRAQAEALIQFMLGDLRDKLQPLGKLALLDAVGAQALEYFAAVPAGALSTLELQSRATALHQIGQVRLAMGKLEEATAAFRDALRTAEDLAARDPADAAHQFALGQSTFWVGYLLWQRRQLGPALEQFLRYLHISEALVARDPRNRAWQLELSYAHSNLGSIYRDQGDHAAAASALERAAAGMQALAARAPGDDALALELAHVQAKLGDLLALRGELAAARPWLERHLAAMQRLSSRAPDDMQRLRFLGYAHSHLGNLRLWQGDEAGAVAHYEEDLAIAERLVAGDADNLELVAELALRENKLGERLRLRGELERARGLLDRERGLVDGLLAHQPSHHPWRMARARSELALAALAAAQVGVVMGARDERALAAAIERTRAAIAALEEVTAPDPRALKAWLPQALLRLGQLQARAGREEEARASWLRGRAIRPDGLGRGEPAQLDVQARLALALARDEEARPLLEELDRMGYRGPELTEARRARRAQESAREQAP